MLAVVTDVSGPMCGEDDILDAVSSWLLTAAYRLWRQQLTCAVHMSLYFQYELPNLRTSLWILETERIVDTVRLRPHNQCVCRALNSQ